MKIGKALSVVSRYVQTCSGADCAMPSRGCAAPTVLYINDVEYPLDTTQVLLGGQKLGFLPDFLGSFAGLTTLRVRRNSIKKLQQSMVGGDRTALTAASPRPQRSFKKFHPDCRRSAGLGLHSPLLR